MGLKERGGKLEVPVAGIVPGMLMGSGLGQANTSSGDYDIQTSDPKTLAEHGLDALRLGDVIAIVDHDSSYGWCYRRGAATIGIVIHGDSRLSGHGPGVTTVLTSSTGHIVPRVSKGANVGKYLKLGRFRTKK